MISYLLLLDVIHVFFFLHIISKATLTTFIKTKLKKSDEQTNIDKYRVAANITEYQTSGNEGTLAGLT